MTTGQTRLNATNKRLLGFTDISDRIVGYVRDQVVQTIKLQWPADGVFLTKLTLAANGANQIRVNGTSLATDGLGRIIDVNSSLFVPNAQFENSNTIVYYVGLFYAEVPDTVIINPRTGLPEYRGITETIGVQAEPTSVTNNGSTLTFNVNSVCEASVSNAGRTVRVYKKIPAAGATTLAVAVEDRTVAFASGNNTITTTSLLGQSSPSTTASDYFVVLLGPSVKRNTDLRPVSGCVFIGTVTGNGGTPVTFSNADQVIVASDLAALLLTNAGAANVAFDPTNAALTKRIPDLSDVHDPQGGIGNNADGTFPPTGATLQALAHAIDKAFRRVRAWTATAGDTLATDQPSELDCSTFNAPYQYGGTFFARRSTSNTLAPYTTTLAEASMTAAPYVLGEQSGVAAIGAPQLTHANKQRFVIARTNFWFGNGKWQRLYFDMQSVTDLVSFNGSSRPPGAILEDCLFRGGHYRVRGTDITLGQMPLDFRNCSFEPVSTGSTVRGSDSTFDFNESSGGANNPGYALFTNSVFLGPNPAQTTPAPAAVLAIKANFGTTGIEATPFERPLKFSNCVFVNARTSTRVVDIASKHKVVFENCYFYGFAAQTVEMIRLQAGSHAVFRDCVFYGTEGSILDAQGAYGSFENCIFISGAGGTTIAQPSVIKAYGGADRSLSFRDCTVLVNTSAIRLSGATGAVVHLGSTEGSGAKRNISVDGLHIVYTGGTGLHTAETLLLYGSPGRAQYANINVDFGGLARTGNGSATTFDGYDALVSIRSPSATLATAQKERAQVNQIKLHNFANPNGADYNTVILYVRCAQVRGVQFHGPDAFSGGADRWKGYLFMDGGAIVSDVVDATGTIRVSNFWIRLWNDDNVLRNVYAHPIEFQGTTPSTAAIRIDGSRNAVSGAHLYSISSAWNSLIDMAGGDNSASDLYIVHAGNGAASPILLRTSYRRNAVFKVVGQWNGTDDSLISVLSDDSLVDGVVARRQAGAVTLVAVAGSNCTTSATVLSTVA